MNHEVKNSFNCCKLIKMFSKVLIVSVCDC